MDREYLIKTMQRGRGRGGMYPFSNFGSPFGDFGGSPFGGFGRFGPLGSLMSSFFGGRNPV